MPVLASFTVSDPVPLAPAYFPLSLHPGQTYTAVLFDFLLPSNLVGSYTGTFSLLGGSIADSYLTLGTQSFTATAVTPEPSSWLLLTSAAIFGVALRVRRSKLAS